MKKPRQFLQFSLFSTLLFTALSWLPNFLHARAISTITSILQNQVSCTMCDSCDNPCQPIILSPPPPPSPSPLSSSDSECPPPPPPSTDESINNYPPPSSPTVPTFLYYSPTPPSPGGGYIYPTPGSNNFPGPPPPNPIVPYFPYYYYNPPSSPKLSHSSFQLKSHTIATTGITLFLFLLFV